MHPKQHHSREYKTLCCPPVVLACAPNSYNFFYRLNEAPDPTSTLTTFKKGNTASGIISQINSRGFTVRLEDNGIEGFVETRTLNKKFSFDPMRLKLNSESLSLQLDMAVKVIIHEIDNEQRSIRFKLAEDAQ